VPRLRLVELFPRFGRAADRCAVVVLRDVLIYARDYFNNNVALINKCVVCHYSQLTVPEPVVKLKIL